MPGALKSRAARGRKRRESISCQWNIPWGKGYGQRMALFGIP